MGTHYLAVTVDVCEHNELYERMNEYQIDVTDDTDRKVWRYAKEDIAPIVELYECNGAEKTLVKKYRFKEYDCNCES